MGRYLDYPVDFAYFWHPSSYGSGSPPPFVLYGIFSASKVVRGDPNKYLAEELVEAANRIIKESPEMDPYLKKKSDENIIEVFEVISDNFVFDVYTKFFDPEMYTMKDVVEILFEYVDINEVGEDLVAKVSEYVEDYIRNFDADKEVSLALDDMYPDWRFYGVEDDEEYVEDDEKDDDTLNFWNNP